MSQVVRWSCGGTPRADVRDYYEGGSIPWLVIGDLNDAVVDRAATHITPSGLQHSSAKLIPPGTLLVALYGSIGTLGITGMECCTNQAIACAKSLSGVTVRYLYYYLLFLRPRLAALGKGGAQNNISLGVLNALSVPVPPLWEQERITARLDNLLSQLADSQRRLSQVQDRLEPCRRAIHAAASAAHPGRRLTLGEAAQLIDGDRGKYYPKGRSLSPQGSCLFLSTQNVRPYGWSFSSTAFLSEEGDRLLGRGKLVLGDVVLTTRGSLGHVAVYDHAVPYPSVRINSCMLILRPRQELISSHYLAAFLRSPQFQLQLSRLRSGTVQPQLPARVLREVELFVPGLAQQEEIACRIGAQMAACQEIEQAVQAGLAQAKLLGRSILARAFRGQL